MLIQAEQCPIAEGLVARPFDPPIPLTLALVFSQQRPMSRIVVRFAAHLKAAAAEMAVHLDKRGLPGGWFG